MQQIAPAFFKPTTTLLIDDDPLYIQNVATLLPERYRPMVITTDRLDDYFESELFTTINNFSRSNQSLSADSVLRFFAEHYDHPPVSTIVIDYTMAPKDGLSILKRFKSSFIQKILISNFLDNNTVRDAINQGIIDFYLPKMDPLFIEKLSESIGAAHRRFFCKLSSMVPDFFSVDNPLNESQLQKIFKSIQSEHDAEYYESSDHLRRFTFFNKNGNTVATIHILPENQIDELVNSIPAESAPKEIRELISSGKTLPLFQDHVIPDGREWHKYLQPACFLNGDKKYVYAICGV